MPQAQASAPDPVFQILSAAPTSDAVRADVWDLYEGAADEDDLAAKLKTVALPQHLKAQLWDLKVQAATRAATALVNASVPASPSMLDTATGAVTDVAKGAVAGLANTVYRGGDLIRRGLGMERIIHEPDVQSAMTPPESVAGKLGYHGEQIAEFFLPTGAPAKFAKAADVAKSGAIALAQTGSPAQAGVTAGLTAAMPGAATVARAAGALSQGAQKTMAQALGATKEWAKAEAAKLAPQMLERGVGGSRTAMLDLANTTAKRVGTELDAAYKVAASAGETVSGDIIRGNIQLAADALQTRLASGASTPIPGTERVVSRLTKLDAFIEKLGPDIPVDRAATIKRTWDHIVSKAGLFGPKATASATDSADSWAFREASNGFRQLLNSNPTIEALNKEVGFWVGLKKVLTETEKRTQAQSGGLVAAGTGGAGAIVGAMSGESMTDRAQNAVLGGLAGRQLVKLVQSPAWRTQVSGPMKQQLAEALASESGGRVASVTSRIIASLPAQLRPSLAP